MGKKYLIASGILLLSSFAMLYSYYQNSTRMMVLGAKSYSRKTTSYNLNRGQKQTPTLISTVTLIPTITLGISPTSTKIPTKTLTPTRTLTPIPTKTPTPTALTNTSSSTGVKWGAYVSWEPSAVTSFQNMIGKKMNHVATFVHWGNESELPSDLGNFTKNNGQTLLIFWEAMDYNVTSPDDSRFNYDSILSGKWDSYLYSFASSSKTLGSPIILVLFEEMNGDWYPWSIIKNNNNAQKHIAAFKYVRQFFTNVPNVKFAWDVNCLSEPGASSNFKDFYPGDQYVDIVGVNGFNFGSPWQSFSQIFDQPLSQLESFGKPIMIFSTASAPSPQKANWIRNFGEEIKKHPQIIGWNWFNENKEKDWRVNSDTESLNAFKSILP